MVLWRLPTRLGIIGGYSRDHVELGAPGLASRALGVPLNFSVRAGLANERGAQPGRPRLGSPAWEELKQPLPRTRPIGLNTKKTIFLRWSSCNSIVAATYFTRFDPSIIGGSGLNFSVRDGKR